MNKTEKQVNIDQMHSEFQDLKNAVLMDFRGLKVVEVTELRRGVRKLSSRYLVVKNTLAKKASEDSDVREVSKLFQGPTAIAYTKSDVVALAKYLLEFAKTHPNLVFKGALVDGKAVSAEQLDAISKLPGRPELLGKLIYLLKAPVTNLATLLKTPVRNLALGLNQVPK